MVEDCHYVVNNNGDVQYDKLAGEALKDCKITKSEYVCAIEAIERMSDKLMKADTTATDTVSKNVSKDAVSGPSK
jgi:hypothetical protein